MSRAIEVFGHYQASQEKFDYFICGVAGALFAYVGEHYVPQKITFGVSALEPLALLFLVLSFFAGLKGIERAIALKRNNHANLDLREKAGNFISALQGGSGPYYNPEGGEIIGQTELIARRAEYLRQSQVIDAAIETLIKREHRYRNCRNIFLLLGFLALLAAKILQPYT